MSFAADPKYLGAKTGMTAILHTWGQNLFFHPHIHCIIPAGGITKGNKWKETRSKGKYLFPVKALSKVFRGKFTDGLINLHNKGIIKMEIPFDPDRKYLHPLYNKKWVVYAKQPMAGPKQVVLYIGKYSHRVAISNHRIKHVDDQQVTFSWLNYRTSKIGLMKLTIEEFLWRFAQHILPFGFMKIRHFGIFSASLQNKVLEVLEQVFDTEPSKNIKTLDWRKMFEMLFGHEPDLCPKCKKGKMIRKESFLPPKRGSPAIIMAPNFDFSKQ
ncbi:MAG TPA: transposase [Draconibacterium sp.]|nr:transposase [Draconibacterium sp.]